MIEVEHLRFEYPGTRALDDVSFRLSAGSITALVGPNGAGKTTLLRCLAGLEPAHAGTIRLDSIDVTANPRLAHRRLGFLPDHFGLYGELSARRCLLYAGRSHGLDGDVLARRVTETAQRVGLSDKLEAAAGTLSRGQRQRLALAQSIVHRPKVLLLDEPASGLDPGARAGLAGLMKRLAIDGMTLIVSSHILAELEEYCTGMLVLGGGRVLEYRNTTRLAGQSAANTFRRLRIRLAMPIEPKSFDDDFRARLPAELGNVKLDGANLEALTAADDSALPVLLRSLLDIGLPVCEFGIVADSLQDSYLAAIGASGA